MSDNDNNKTPPTTATTPATGGGFTNYKNWDKIATTLVTETERENEEEEKIAAEQLGQTRQPYKAAEAKFRARDAIKGALDRQRARETSAICVVDNVLSSRGEGGKEEVVVVDEERLGEKRVIAIRNCVGPGTVALPASLSRLTHAAGEAGVRVEGVIKVFVEECRDCTVVVDCKIVTSVVEIHKCENVRLEVSRGQRVSTIQADLTRGLNIVFGGEGCFGCAKEDKIYHAGVSDMKVVIMADDGTGIKMEKTADYLKDGAVAQLNATPEEYQFVTSVVDGALVTERLIRLGTKAMTQRELDEERLKRGESSVSSSSVVVGSGDEGENDCRLSMEELVDVVRQCFTNKADGNEAFKSGEYAQAVLFYSLCIDKGSKLQKPPQWDSETNITTEWFNDVHICYANRSACFLKLGHHEKALDDAESSLRLEPTYLKALFRKGMALHAMKRYEEALPVLAECHKMEPKNKQIKQALQFCEVFFQKEMRKRMEKN